MQRMLLIFSLLATSAAWAEQAASNSPLDNLQAALSEPQTAFATLNALRATGDPNLLPLFEAVARKGNDLSRRASLGALAEMGGSLAAPALFDRVKNDPQPLIQAEALAYLTSRKMLSVNQLTEIAKMSDPKLRCISARALIREGKYSSATPVLSGLTASAELPTACLSRMSLLGAGDASQLPLLEKIVKDPATDPELTGLLMDQISEEKVSAATELAKFIAENADSISLKVRAYRAMAVNSPQGPAMLADTIAKSDQTVFRVQLLHILATLGEARGQLESLARGSDLVAELAQLELARTGGSQLTTQGAAAAKSAIASGHGVVIDYVLDCAARDIAAGGGKGELYVPALVELIISADPDSTAMKTEHAYAAQAATLLGDLGSDQARKALAEFLAGQHTATMRAVAAGLLRSKNRAVCPLVAPLLGSPYEELSTDAALILGRFGEPAARPILQEIVSHPKRHPTELIALASWYLLNIDGQCAQAVKTLAETFK